MKITITTKDDKQAKRLLKANDMACFIFNLQNNLWRQFKHTDYDFEPYQKAIVESLESHEIDIDQLID